jgi:GrpB-like predicted nucleotidyltransferase (UPF0157 family)
VDPAHLSAAIAALEGAGYTHRGDLGIPGREAIAHPPLPEGEAKRNIYVCVDGPALRNHLAVRDVLREDEGLRNKYAAVKWALAGRGVGIEEYMRGKTEVIQEILGRAGRHSEAELADIVGMNDR